MIGLVFMVARVMRAMTQTTVVQLMVYLSETKAAIPLCGGAGAKFTINEQFALRLEYQNYADLSDIPGRKDDVQGLFAGGVYRF